MGPGLGPTTKNALARPMARALFVAGPRPGPLSYVLCPVSSVLCPMSNVICHISYVLSYGLCPKSYVLWPMSYGQGMLLYAR